MVADEFADNERSELTIFAFGSHMPFDYVGPSLVKLAALESLSSDDHEKIAWRNAATFLGLDE